MSEINHEQVTVKTPEYVSLQFTTAGLGSRAAALIIDHLILTVVNLLIFAAVFFIGEANLGIMISLQGSTVPIAFAIIALFVLNWSYFFFMEFFYGGRTIGKKLMGIRAIQDNGHSLTLLSSFIRNLLRIIDMLPVSYFLGMVMIFFHSKHKRVGDLAAGTIVVHEKSGKRKEKGINKEIQQRNLAKGDLNLDDWALRSFGRKEWELLKNYSDRFLQLPEVERDKLTNQLASILLPKAGLSAEGKNSRELENNLLILYLIVKEEWEFE